MNKLVRFIFISIFLLQAAPAPAQTTDYGSLIRQGDMLFSQRSDMAKADLAYQTYKMAIGQDPNQSEAYWKTARALYWIGKNSPKKEQATIFQEAVTMGERAVALDPENPATHYWLGLMYGMYGGAKGIMKSLSLVDSIKNEMAEVIRLNPEYDQGGAYLILGRLYYELPGIAGGSNKKAEEYYLKSLSIGPKRWITRVYLAELYIDKGRYQEARQLLNEAIEGPCQKEEKPDCLLWKRDAQNVMKKLEKKAK